MTPTKKRNIRLELSYNGADFFGYQFQPHGRTVQGSLMEAWQILTGVADDITGCSRLDSGVHANRYVLNIRSDTTEPCERILRGLNGILFHNLQVPVSIYQAVDVDLSFHARFDAVGKHYRYLLWHGYGMHAHLCPRSWIVRTRQSLAGIDAVFKQFEGSHDFSAFRALDCSSKNVNKTIHKIDVWQHETFPELTVVDIWGDGFLKNMIRNIVGSAVEVMSTKLHKNAIIEAFEHGDRTIMGQCAPSHGLRLENIFYSREAYFAAIEKTARHIAPN